MRGDQLIDKGHCLVVAPEQAQAVRLEAQVADVAWLRREQPRQVAHHLGNVLFGKQQLRQIVARGGKARREREALPQVLLGLDIVLALQRGLGEQPQRGDIVRRIV